LRPQFQDLVACILPSLLGIGEIATTLIKGAARRESLRQQIFEVFDVDGEKLDTLVGNLDDLVERGLELGEVLALRGELAFGFLDQVGVLAFALAKHLDSAGVTLTNVGLDDLGERLALHHVIANRDVDRREPACRIGNRFDNLAAAADQNPLTGGAGRNPSDHPPGERSDKRHANDRYQDPVRRLCNLNEVVELFGRRGALQRHGSKCPL
jgi:hypothetical protein